MGGLAHCNRSTVATLDIYDEILRCTSGNMPYQVLTPDDAARLPYALATCILFYTRRMQGHGEAAHLQFVTTELDEAACPLYVVAELCGHHRSCALCIRVRHTVVPY